MNFQDAEKIYRDLKQQNVAGKLTNDEFEAKVGELWCQDAQGNWWQIGVESGDWYMYDGQKWNKATPPSVPSAPATPPTAPAAPAPAPVVPASPPPASEIPATPPAAPTVPPTTPTPAPPSAPAAPTAPSPALAKPPPAPTAPAPAPSAPTTPAAPSSATVVPTAPPRASSSATEESGAALKDTRDSVPPARREGVAPAGSGRSLPTPLLVGIGAVVSVIAFILVISGCFFLSGLLGSSATATPTRSLALLPSPVIATPTFVPTDTPLPSPTIEITPTLTETRPPPTRRPTPTPAGPTATATLNVPPGVYVTDIETLPAKVNIGDTIGFKVSFLNTTGSVQAYNWYVKWYQCPEECQDFKHSHGETLEMNSNLAPGPSTLSTSQNIDLRPGIRCDLIAVANYIDPVNQLPTAFQATKNDGHFSFTACH